MEMKEQIYVTTIARYGNIKDAAIELHLSSPALSIFLSTLERNIGISLFDRIGKQFVPTAAGQLYIQHAKKILSVRDNYEKELKNLKGEISGIIHLGIHPRRTLHLLPRTVTEFASSHPHIQLIVHELSNAEMLSELAEGSLDLIITNKKDNNPHLSWQPFYEDHLVVILPSGHPAASRSVPLPDSRLRWLDLSCLKEERFILQKEFQSTGLYARQAIKDAGITLSHTFIIENLEAASQMAAEGFGVAFNFESYARFFSYPKPVSCFLTGDPHNTVSYYMATNLDKYHPGYLTEFMDLLDKYMKLQMI